MLKARMISVFTIFVLLFSFAGVKPALANGDDPVCQAGSYFDGVNCVPASPGYFVPAHGATEQTPCAPGYYQPASGAILCIAADPGYFVDIPASDVQTPCPVGYYQPFSGAIECNAAPAGSFVSTEGAIEATLCPVGKYQDLTGQSVCKNAEPGSFVSTQGAIAPILCAIGTYQPNSGASSCILASPGYFVSATGSVAQTACPVGYTSSAGASFCTLITFNFSGFLQPVDSLPTLNVVKAGQAVPVKFSLNGYQGMNILMIGYPVSTWTTCSSTTTDVVEETSTAGASGLTYDSSTDQYKYTWKTEKAWQNSSRTLTLKFTDGTIHQAYFQFKK